MNSQLADAMRALRIYDDAFSELSFYVGHTLGRVGEAAHARAVEVCNSADGARKIFCKLQNQLGLSEVQQ